MGKKQSDLKKEVISKTAEDKYILTAKAHGISEQVAKEAYNKNKDQADRLTEFQIKQLAESGNAVAAAQKINNLDKKPIDVGGVSGQRLRSFLDRIERLESEKKALADDIRDIYAEAKATGFDPKIIKKCYKLRLMNAEKRREEKELLELYASALQLELF